MGSDNAARPEPTVDQIRALLDKQQISEKIYLYCRGVDRLDADVVDSVYWPDAYDEHGAIGTLRGAECAEVLVTTMRNMCQSSMHTGLNLHIELEGDNSAYSELYFLSYQIWDEDGTQMVRTFAGRYVDRFERRGEEWRIAHRVIVHDWSRIDPVDRPWATGHATMIQGARSKDDLIYHIRAGVDHVTAMLPDFEPIDFRNAASTAHA